jgi:acetyl esterase
MLQVTDYHTPGTASYAEFRDDEAMVPTRSMMENMFEAYVQNEADVYNPLVCPLKATDLSELPSALIFTAHRDVLRDEAEAFASRLQSAG